MGNHTFHHPDMSAISDQSKFQQELEELEQLYQETTGQTLPPVLPPSAGKYSEENLRQAQALGYRTVFWSLAYVDWYVDDQPTAEEAFSKLIPPHPQWGHRAAPLHLPDQRRDPGRAAHPLGGHGLHLRLPGGPA